MALVNKTFQPITEAEAGMSNQEAQAIIDARNSEQQILASYGVSGVAALDLGLGKSLAGLLSDSSIPEARKKALIAELQGKISNMPNKSELDTLSEQILGRSNYMSDTHKISEQIGEIIGRYLNTDYQEDYNANELGRLRDQGVNTDLANVASASPGQAADYDDQSGDSSDLSPATSGSEVISTIMQAINGTMSFTSGIMGLVKEGVSIESLMTDNLKSESDLIADFVSRSGIYPSSALDFSFGGVFQDKDGKEYPLNFKDKDGNFIPYDKLSSSQRDVVQKLANYHDTQNDDLFNSFFANSGFSRSKRSRLRNRFYNYLKSPEFYRTYYENMLGFRSAQQQKQGIEASPLFTAFDSLINNFQVAFQRASYTGQYEKNLYDTDVYKNLIKEGVPASEAAVRARVALRDEEDNRVLDEIRNTNNEIMTNKESSALEKFFARVSSLFLYFMRNKL